MRSPLACAIAAACTLAVAAPLQAQLPSGQLLSTYVLTAPWFTMLPARPSSAAVRPTVIRTMGDKQEPMAKPITAPPAPQIPGWARLSFYGNGSTTTDLGGNRTNSSELITSLAAQAPVRDTAGIDYGLDVRFAGYPSSLNRATRASIFNAYAGYQTDHRVLSVKVGQLWLNDLGALGSVGGGVVEMRRQQSAVGGYIRAGAFGGLEPEILQAGYVSGVRKMGAYFAIDGDKSPRRHVVGYVNVRNGSITERSVLTFSNFLPLANNNVFIYQAGEFDIAKPARLAESGLSYFFTNVRARSGIFEVQGTYHRGRSIDVRTLALDQINGRPISASQLDGFLFESAGARFTIEVVKNVRLIVGAFNDKNNALDANSQRFQAGIWATDLGGSGLDVNITDSRTRQAGVTSYDSWYASIGRAVATRVYLTGEFSTAVSVLRFGTNLFDVQSRPHTRRYAGSAIFRVYRPASVLLTVERVDDSSFSETRFMSGLTYRF